MLMHAIYDALLDAPSCHFAALISSRMYMYVYVHIHAMSLCVC